MSTVEVVSPRLGLISTESSVIRSVEFGEHNAAFHRLMARGALGIPIRTLVQVVETLLHMHEFLHNF
ncbi:hypothetical protein ABT127_29650 [Streptomyces sp. NPDC001904]|uniref:hypothetical protein n=1 Tax=Streptomyces sp. NPDC001904 TaxID=3154531 RepID=UPI00331E233D